MSIFSRAVTPDAGFDELAVVALRSLVTTEAGDLKPGTIGTIVHRHSLADAYEVEFDTPVPIVLTLRGRDLTLAA